jgi:hypothetical protein
MSRSFLSLRTLGSPSVLDIPTIWEVNFGPCGSLIELPARGTNEAERYRPLGTDASLGVW